MSNKDDMKNLVIAQESVIDKDCNQDEEQIQIIKQETRNKASAYDLPRTQASLNPKAKVQNFIQEDLKLPVNDLKRN